MAKSTALLLILSSTLLVSCGTVRPEAPPQEVRVEVLPEVDSRLLSCAARPSQPLDSQDPVQAGQFVLDLGSAYQDCSSTLDEFAAWYLEARIRLEKAQKESF